MNEKFVPHVGLSHGARAQPPTATVAFIVTVDQWPFVTAVAHVTVSQHAIAQVQIASVHRSFVLVSAEVLALYVAHGRSDQTGRRVRSLWICMSHNVQRKSPSSVSSSDRSK